MSRFEKYKIGVFGSAGGEGMTKNEDSARLVGRGIANLGGILCTGACPGIPHTAALAADNNQGLVLGYSPAINLFDHVNNYKFPVEPYVLTFTGMEKKGRNLICTRSCDAGIFIAGRWGSVNEFTLMCDEGEGKVIGLLAGSGGFVDSMIIPGLQTTDKTTKAVIIIGSNPEALVQSVFMQLAKIKRK